jgi:hypothetical protein
MITQWTKNLRTEEDKKRFESTLQGSKIILDRLQQLLEEEEKDIDYSETNLGTYETPNWAAKQAHKNGQRAMLQKIKSLINLDQ